MQEEFGPSPDEIGEKETGPISKEEMGEKFETFIHEENKLAGFSTRVVKVEKDKLFDIVDYKLTPDLPRTILRQYWGYHPAEVDEPFSTNGVARIVQHSNSVELEKTGRLGIDPSKRRPETEILQLFLPIQGGFGLLYIVSNINGEELASEVQETGGATSVISVTYDEEGKIDTLSPEHRDMTGHKPVYYQRDGTSKGLSDLKEIAEKGEIIKKEGVNLKIEFDHNVDSFVVTMFDRSGKPDYKVIVPERVDLETIRAETGADKLLADPYQPAEGTPGKSVGDIDWRHKSFPDLTGIKIFPIDTEESIPGPK